MKKHLQPIDIINKKNSKSKITMLTAYDAITAHLISQSEIDMILVGDSLGNTIAGFENTIPVTMDQMVLHAQYVSRGNSHCLVVGDMPFLSYQTSIDKARENAGRLIKEGHAHAIKVEMVNSDTSTVQAIIDMGIPVIGHIGFTPQSIYQLGGYKVQGREETAGNNLIQLAKELEKCGCFAVILEMVLSSLAKEISKTISIPTIGIGASKYCDGQVLVLNDLIGLNTGFSPKFSKQYCNIADEIENAITSFKSDVENEIFPNKKIKVLNKGKKCQLKYIIH